SRTPVAAARLLCQIAGGYRNGFTLPFSENLQEIPKENPRRFKTDWNRRSSLSSGLRLSHAVTRTSRSWLEPVQRLNAHNREDQTHGYHQPHGYKSDLFLPRRVTFRTRRRRR